MDNLTEDTMIERGLLDPLARTGLPTGELRVLYEPIICRCERWAMILIERAMKIVGSRFSDQCDLRT